MKYEPFIMLCEKDNGNQKTHGSFSLDLVFQDESSLVLLRNKHQIWATVSSSRSEKLDHQKPYLGHMPIVH